MPLALADVKHRFIGLDTEYPLADGRRSRRHYLDSAASALKKRSTPNGRSIKVEGVCQGNMHAAWDTCLLEKAVGSDPIAAADQLEQEITDADRSQWVGTGPVDWANESYAVSTGPSTSTP